MLYVGLYCAALAVLSMAVSNGLYDRMRRGTALGAQLWLSIGAALAIMAPAIWLYGPEPVLTAWAVLAAALAPIAAAETRYRHNLRLTKDAVMRHQGVSGASMNTSMSTETHGNASGGTE